MLRELVKGGASNDANLEIAFTIIEASDDREMVEAFFDLPIKESAKVINKWMLAAQHEGASLPQS
ncbi:MAG: hypothetical protein LBH11_03375 [Propionibacteriaceae bacterium]|nr:hypothetical protein [Propionibacteriaceae bacterium]